MRHGDKDYLKRKENQKIGTLSTTSFGFILFDN